MKEIMFPAELLFQCAVYKLMRGDKILYIGKTGTMFGRFAHHHIITREIIEQGDQIQFVFCEEGELDELECSMIQEFKPELNLRAGGAGRPLGDKEDGITKLVKGALDVNKGRRDKRKLDSILSKILDE